MKKRSIFSTPRITTFGKMGIQIRILKIIVSHILISIFIFLLYGYIISIRWVGTSSFLFWGLTGVTILLFGGITYIFYWRVYLPILRFLGSIELLRDQYDSDDTAIQRSTSITPHLTNLNSLLIQLQDTMDREFRAKILKKQAEIDALQSQINPHFLYNTLEAIRSQAIIEGVNEIANMTEALSAFFRYSISQRGRIVTLEDELKNVDIYFAIQQYRFSDKFRLVKIMDDDVDLYKYKLPKLTIQPIVENAIYHGLETKIGEGCITIRVTVTEKRLIIDVQDDGIGIEKSKLDEINSKLDQGIDYSPQNQAIQSLGIALFNVNQRIKLNFGEMYGLTVYSTLDLGTDVKIELPLLKDE